MRKEPIYIDDKIIDTPEIKKLHLAVRKRLKMYHVCNYSVPPLPNTPRITNDTTQA